MHHTDNKAVSNTIVGFSGDQFVLNQQESWRKEKGLDFKITKHIPFKGQRE